MYKCNEFYQPFTDTFKQKVSYASFVCDHRPLKSEQWRERLVVGGDKLTCPYDTGSPAANLLETKLLLNNIISYSDKGARYYIRSQRSFSCFTNTNSRVHENTTKIHTS